MRQSGQEEIFLAELVRDHPSHCTVHCHLDATLPRAAIPSRLQAAAERETLFLPRSTCNASWRLNDHFRAREEEGFSPPIVIATSAVRLSFSDNGPAIAREFTHLHQ